MQNLQIKYGEFSAQLEYLEQYDLVQEEEIHHHVLSDFGELSENSLEFVQANVEERQPDEAVSFPEFVAIITRVKLEDGKLFHRVINVLLGDIMEYEYELNHRTPIRTTTFFIRQKWPILCHLLLFVAIVASFSLEYLLILTLALWLLTVEQKEDSQLQLAESFKPTFSNLSSQIKCIYLDKSIYSSLAIDSLNHSLERVVKHLQTKHDLNLNESPFIIDQLNESLHLLLQAAAKRHFSKNYFDSRSMLKKKYFYWRLKLENRQLSRLVTALHAILKNFLNNKRSEPIKRVKPKPEENVYFRLLIAKLQQQYHSIQNGKTCYHIYGQLLSLLRKEVEFKKVLRFHQQKIGQAQEKNIEQSPQEVPVFHQDERSVINSYYFEDNNLVPYEPQHTESIRYKLNELFSKKQAKSNQSPFQVPPKEPTLQKMVQKPERSIFSFGIPLIPPLRDLSAFYFQ